MGKGGGGVDLDGVVEATERNIEFQTDIGNRALALAAPFNQVGFNSLGDLAVIYGVDAPTLRPNYGGTLDDPRFVPLDHGTVEDRLQALGDAPAQNITTTTTSPGRGPDGQGIPGIDFGRGEGQGGWVNPYSGGQTSTTSESPNPAYQEWLDKKNQILAEGDLPGPLSTEERREKVLANFYDSPIYRLTFDNALEQSTKAIQRAAAARGQLNAAPTFNAIGTNAGRLANQTFGQFEGGLSKLAGFGTTGLSASTNALSNTGAQVGSSLNNLANAHLTAAQQNASQNSSGFGGLGSLIGAGLSFL